MPVLYFEDVEVGMVARSGGYTVTREEIIEFAQRWDPWELHLDDRAGVARGFGGVIASGAHSAAILALLYQRAREKEIPYATVAGLGAEIRLTKPVRPGDTLRYRGEVIEKRPSARNPQVGVIKTRSQLLNQRDEVVYDSVFATLVQRRPEQGNESVDSQ
ncbi:MAG: acyl dehydratase [Deltaproteobacteria bacterium]|nr:acyl dehydratase [Deltaproteobacteria bacterium]